MEAPTPNNSELKIKHKNYEILIKFKTTELNIIITNIQSFPKLVYEGSFSLEDLKKNNKFFKMFDNINEIYNDLKTLVNNENSFYIQELEKSLSFVINKQFAINNDIIFPLKKKDSNINEIIHELCIKNNELSVKYEDLSKKYKNVINELDYLKKKFNSLEMLILNEDVKIIIDTFFDIKPKKFSKIYQGTIHGDKAEDLFKYCGEKDNLIILFEDENNNKFGGFISKKLPKDNSKNIKIRDEKAFLFSLKGKKKFKVLNPENAVLISKKYPLCFGGEFNNNDLYTVSPFFEKDSGMNTKDTYGDKNYEISNGQSSFKLKDIIIYQIEFFD